ncbi:basic salivary proline-rich protein 1-like [Schistocerca americana]|uniref:basic salivary proline-rich protein 1-like n=1 Tax=Schistocerca americana TaxID=7009 RepID=UPI001F4F7056|nr:basic salivary proline-rich protein 1-like [Schistocerca americana]
MDNAVDSDNSVSMREAPIEQNTISRDSQLTEDKSHLPDHVVLSVNQWTPQAATMLPQFLVIVRTQSGLACEVKPPSSVDDARKLLSHISALDARHTISEVIVVNSDPESVVGSRQGETGWLRLLRTLLPPPQPPPPLDNPWSEQSPRHPPPVQLRACLSHPTLQAANMPAYWKEVFAIIIPPQHQSDHRQKPGGPESGNKRPLDGSHNQSSYTGKQGEQTENHRIQPFPPPHVSQSQKGAPSGIPVSGNSCRINGSNNKGQKSPPGEGGKQPKLAFPVPFGSYSKKPVHNTVKQLEETLSAGPYSGNNCPSDGSYNQSHLPPPGKGGKHKEKHPDRLTNANSGNNFPKFTFPPPFGSYNLKPVNKPLRPVVKTPTGVQNSINMNPSDGSRNHRQILPPGNQGEQRKNHRIHPFPPPHGSLSQKGTPPGGPNRANSCRCNGSNNKGQKSPTGRGEKQPKKGLLCKLKVAEYESHHPHRPGGSTSGNKHPSD